MKRIIMLFLILAAFITGINAQKKWKELDAFHEVISQTFHPAEEGKLQPIKTRSREMVDKAIAWRNSTAPEGFDQKAVKKNLKELVKSATELNDLVKSNASDPIIKEKLSHLHDVFHQILEKCEKEGHTM
jgi:hypothetical protein